MFSLYIGGSVKNRTDRAFVRILLCNGLLLSSDAAAWLFKGHISLISYWGVRSANFLVYTLGYILMALFTEYLTEYLSMRGKIPRSATRFVWGLCIVGVGLTVLSQWNHMYYGFIGNNVYCRGDLFWLSQFWGFVGIAVDIGLLFVYRRELKKNEMWVLLSYIFLPVLAMIVQMYIYGIAWFYLATTISIIFIYVTIQANQAQKRKLKEMEVERARTAIMLSQVQPHFLYNTLQGIKHLCDTNPPKASEALEHFSFYLRGNLDSLTKKGLIPFEREMRHVKDYLYLEKMRFDEKLTIKLDLQYTDFWLPAMTVQPIAENAVRWGIIKKRGGGTLTIRSESDGGNIIVSVIDDGVGFDPLEKKKDGRTHVGIENVRQRLMIQCGGTIDIKSQKGSGTTVRIILPEKNDSY
ncbi:MAG: histidine kinase [Anaerostipes sp.]|nr:histidine kinase [Anaerostipes sp.]